MNPFYKQKPLTIVLDVDGVVVDFLGATMKFLGTNYGIGQHIDDLDRWDFLDCPRLHPYAKVARAHWATPGFAAALPELWGARQAVQRLATFGNIRFATSPMASNPTWIEERNEWIFAAFGVDDVVHTGTKSEVPGDVFVDDKYENVIEYRVAHPDALVMLRTWPYNIQAPWSGPRIANLMEAVKPVGEMWKSYNSLLDSNRV